MNKKVGILNFHYSNNNYGAVLQAAALSKSIKDIGYLVETIDFIPVSIKKPKSVRNIVGDLLRAVGLKKAAPEKPKVENGHVFEDFRCEWLPRTIEQYHNLEDLNAIAERYSAVVVGSDQVWRPAMTLEFAAAYFLSFVPNSCHRVSYAASFGVDYWQEKNICVSTAEIKKEVQKFHSVSVREDSGVDICKEIFNVKAQHVLDPTLLAGRELFDDIIKQAQVEAKVCDVVYYKLDIDDLFLKQIEQIESLLNYTSENIYYYKQNELYFYKPVAEWLSNLRECKLIITDSFHCICFAILFEKQFVYLPNKERGMSRLESLLGQLGLKNRICYDPEKLSDKNFVEEVIEYAKVNSKLAELRVASLEFISSSLRY